MKKMNPYLAVSNPFDLFYAPMFRSPYWGFVEYPFGAPAVKRGHAHHGYGACCHPHHDGWHHEHPHHDEWHHDHPHKSEATEAAQACKCHQHEGQPVADLAQHPKKQVVSAAAPRMKQFGLMRTDVKETEEAYELQMNLPGFAKEDIKVELKDGCLTVCAASQESHEQTDDEGAFIRRERYSGSCQRSFWLGDDVLEEGIAAKFDEGVLTITVPKDLDALEEAAPREIAIA